MSFVFFSNREIKKRFSKFLNEFQETEGSDFSYRKKIRDNYKKGRFYLKIDLTKLASKDYKLVDQFKLNPARILPLFEESVKEIIEKIKPTQQVQEEDDTTEETSATFKPCQLLFSWQGRKPTSIRTLDSNNVSKLIFINGIVTKCSRTVQKVTNGVMQCPVCKHQRSFGLISGESFTQLPFCTETNQEDNSKCKGRYEILVHLSTWQDSQRLKVQEMQEDVPTGEIPRSLSVDVSRYLVEKAPPGTRVRMIGIYCTNFKHTLGKQESSSIKVAYVRGLGMETINMSERLSSSSSLIQIFDDYEEEKFKLFAKTENLYEVLASNIDPGIFGHKDIKKAIMCQLFGGSTRIFKDGNRRRGDINILLLGDPSTAKSQLLKFTEKIAPVAIYTSGKGSSAAGLTASVVKEPTTGEFYLEGGSMVLADGGICCIDEFDKMSEQDRVAIHEAMEQQTISIAKAGITTVLNSRTAVLAAANPLGGRYEDFKSPEEQIDFQTTILSRFDLIFIVKDNLNKKQDEEIANHVTNLHLNYKSLSNKKKNTDYDLKFLTNYISYCRRTCFPRITEEAVQYLTDFYAKKRKERGNSDNQVIPLTVRQLEALVRIAEALAKMELQEFATRRHAEEAVRLFKMSTLSAIKSGELGRNVMNKEEIEKIESLIKSRVGVKKSSRVDWIMNSLEKSDNIHGQDTEKTLYLLVKKGEFKYTNKRKSVYRKK